MSHDANLNILIVDDDPGQRSLLNTFLAGNGFSVTQAASGKEALEILPLREFAMVISDVRMPGLSGLEMLRQLRLDHADLPVLLVTAHANIRDAVDAMRDGALNYLSKPIDLDELLALVRNATGVRQSETTSGDDTFSLPTDVISQSPLMHSVFRDAALVAPSDSRVLITGESGVGKEVLADTIHAWSKRSEAPIIKINCAAIPENLLESELFGHEKGSFTGAHQKRTGHFEAANGGTIFLDEIGEMSPGLQAKLLRITQDGCFRRVGSNLDLKTDVRILAATNRDLEKQIEEGGFREDLYYRLNVLELNIPPLRERPEDILPLAMHFIKLFVQGKPRFSNSVVECLKNYSWPGNVRELKNAMERAALVSRGEIILPEHLTKRIRAEIESTRKSAVELSTPTDTQRLEEIERDAILQALRDHGFNRTETAKTLAISRRSLTYKLKMLREKGYNVDTPGLDSNR